VGSKQVMITEALYRQLKRIRDDNNLTSFTGAIQMLVNFHKNAKNQVDALLASKDVARLSDVRRMVEEILLEKKV